MKKYLLLASVATFAFPAFAADVVFEEPPAPVVIDVPASTGWSGLYVGVHGGYGFGDSGELSLSPFAFPGLVTAFTPAGAAPGSSFAGGGGFDDGFVGGAHIGYDWQVNNLVLGAILDVTYTDIGDRQSAFSRTPATYTISRDLDWLATLRGRLGYAVNDRLLIYGTGGLAYGDVDFGYSQPGSAAAFTTSGGQDSDFGYVVGGGVETKLTDNISLGLEYLYTNLGGNDFRADLVNGPFGGPAGAPGSSPTGTTLTGSDDDFDFHTIQAKISYRF
jgi:outer membrane immunogenic protein